MYLIGYPIPILENGEHDCLEECRYYCWRPAADCCCCCCWSDCRRGMNSFLCVLCAICSVLYPPASINSSKQLAVSADQRPHSIQPVLIMTTKPISPLSTMYETKSKPNKPISHCINGINEAAFIIRQIFIYGVKTEMKFRFHKRIRSKNKRRQGILFSRNFPQETNSRFPNQIDPLLLGSLLPSSHWISLFFQRFDPNLVMNFGFRSDTKTFFSVIGSTPLVRLLIYFAIEVW